MKVDCNNSGMLKLNESWAGEVVHGRTDNGPKDGEVVHGRTDNGPKDGIHRVVGRALPAFTINVDCISVGSAHPTKLPLAMTGNSA